MVFLEIEVFGNLKFLGFYPCKDQLILGGFGVQKVKEEPKKGFIVKFGFKNKWLETGICLKFPMGFKDSTIKIWKMRQSRGGFWGRLSFQMNILVL